MQDCASVPGLAVAEALYGRPQWREYDLGDAGDDARFWEVWHKRQAEVVLVMLRPDGRLVLQTKAIYPSGAYRIPTGGILRDEPLLDALARELREETGQQARVRCLLGVLCYRFRRAGVAHDRQSYVFLLDIGPEPLRPEDGEEEISAYREVRLEDLPAVAADLECRPGEWAVWGRFRALVHWFVAGALGCDA
mgnify:CR=1 FL=1